MPYNLPSNKEGFIFLARVTIDFHSGEHPCISSLS
jgi:hypothetical protein